MDPSSTAPEEQAAVEVVPAYTLDDFISGTRPYEDVYNQRADPFRHERAKFQMEKTAAALGFKQFKSFYKQYAESMIKIAKNDIQYLSNPSEFSGQRLELECGKWKCTDGGVVGFYSDTECVACHHPIMPVEILVNIDTGEEKLRIAYRKRGMWREITVSKTILYNSRKITELAAAGIDVTSESAKMLVAFLQDMENLNQHILPVRQSVGRLGYVSGGFAPYVDGLVFDGDTAYTPIYNAIRSHGSFDEWLTCIKQVRAESVVAKIIIAASFASVLVQPFGALPFFVHLWGVDSGTGKTVGLMAAASVWGSPALGDYIQTFNSTAVSNERTAAFLNSLPLLMDELQLARERNGKNGGFNVYQLAQGVGRGRGNKNGGIDRAPTWGNTILTTGETPLINSSAGAGAVNRVIDIECTANQRVINDGRSVSAVLKQNYGYAGRYFVERISHSQAMDVARETFNDYFVTLSKSDTTKKQAMAAAMILTADLLACVEVFRTDDALSVSDIAPFLASKAEVSAGERAYKYLLDWVAINSKRFATSEENNGEVYGVIDDGVAFIIRAKFTAACEQQGYDPRSTLSWLKVNHKILTRGKHLTRGRRINGLNVECIAMPMPDAEAEATQAGDVEPF